VLPPDALSSDLIALRVAEHLHGHLGWLAAAALVHPAILLRDARRRARLSVGLGAGVATAAAALGMALYPAYRERLKPSIFADAPALGFAFERKEHLAFGALLMAWAGAAAYAAASAADAGARRRLRRASHACFVAAALFATATAALGTCVAAYRTF
jgi:hypothetical protein